MREGKENNIETKSNMPKKIQKRYNQLISEINSHNYLYHAKDSPEISDRDFDKLFSELIAIENEFPDLIAIDSPSQKVGGEVLTEFKKQAHRTPMLSLQNTYSASDLIDFDKRIKKYLNINLKEDITYFCSPKLDGLAIELIYENNILTNALTRGDGLIGEDVTSNVKTIKNLPHKLNSKKVIPLLEVRGEIVIYKKDFLKLNEQQVKLNKKIFANSRNAAAGTIRQLDPKIASTRPLKVLCYSLGESQDITFSSQLDFEKQIDSFQIPALERSLSYSEFKKESNNSLKKNNQISKTCCLCLGINEVIEFYKDIENLREHIPVDIDGIVIKVNDFGLQQRLGFIARSPRWAVAAKYEPEKSTTVIKEIQIQIGRTGALTPVATMDPVSVGGVIVTHATLHNQDEINKKDIRIGDHVIIQRAGDVIPEIVSVIKEKRAKNSKAFVMSKQCPSCNELAHKEESEAVLRCINKKCAAKIIESIKHFVSRKTMNIDKLGNKIVEKFFNEGLISNFSDIYKLSAEQIENLDRQGKKSTENILASIEKSKDTELHKFLFSLGIRFVGEQTARSLSKHYLTLDKFLKTSAEELNNIEDIGPKVTESIMESLGDKTFLSEVQNLLDVGISIKPIKQNNSKQILKKLTFVITGTLPVSRSEAKNFLIANGAKVSSSLSKKTDYLLAGEKSGSKLNKAKELKVKIVSWQEILKLV